MFFSFPIVGLSHFVDDIASTINEVEASTHLQLVWEDSNRYSPYAIAVIWHIQQIGYVEDDYARIIRASLPDCHEAKATFAKRDIESKKTFWASIEVENIANYCIVNSLDLSPFHGLAIPDIGRVHRLHLDMVLEQCAFIDNYVSNGKMVEEDMPVFIQFLEQFKQEYGLSLSGEDRLAEMEMDETMDATIWWWVDKGDVESQVLAADLLESLSRLRNRHHHYASTPQRCAQIYQSERARVRKELKDSHWLQDYDTVLTSQQIKLHDEEKRLLNWLYQLPHNIYSFRSDIQLFATKLFYLRLSWRDLMCVYVYEECLEHVIRRQGRKNIIRNRPKESGVAKIRENITDATLFMPKYDPQDFVQFDEEIRATIRKAPYRLLPQLVDSIRLYQKYDLIPKDFGGRRKMKQWVAAFNAEYGLHIDYSSFCRTYKQQVKDNPNCVAVRHRVCSSEDWNELVYYGCED